MSRKERLPDTFEEASDIQSETLGHLAAELTQVPLDSPADVNEMFDDDPPNARARSASSTKTFLNRDQSYEGIAVTGSDESLPKLGTAGVAKRLYKLALEQKMLLGLAIVALVVSSVAGMAIPALVGRLLDAVGGDPDISTLNSAILWMFLVTSLASVFTLIRNILFTVAGERVVTRLRKLLFAAIMEQEIGFFDTNKSGELVNRLASDSQVIQNAATTNISMGLRFTGQLLVGIVFLFVISWKLTLVLLTMLPFLIGGGIFFGRYIKKVSKLVQDALAKSGDVANEVIGAIRTVRAFSKDYDEVKKYAVCVDESYRLSKQRAIARGAFVGVGTQIGGMAVLGVVYYGGVLVIDGELTAGTLTSFILYTVTVSAAVAVLSELYGDFMKAIGSSERVFQLIDRQPTIRNNVGTPLPARIEGVVRFEHVTFAYPSRAKSVVLADFSMELRPGKVVALVGPSGGGKCLGRGTRVLMASGEFKRVESIVAGERVMGDDGTPRTVTGVTQGRERMVRIVPISDTKAFDWHEKKRLNDERELARQTGKAELSSMPAVAQEAAFVCNMSHVLSIKLSGLPNVRKTSRDRHARTLQYSVQFVVASRDAVGVVTRLAERTLHVRTARDANILCVALGRAVDARLFGGETPAARDAAVGEAIDTVVRTLSDNDAKQTSGVATASTKRKSSISVVAEAVDDDDDNDVGSKLVLSDARRHRLVGALRARLHLAPPDVLLSCDETIDIAVKDFLDPLKTSASLRRVAKLYHPTAMQFPACAMPAIDPWLLGCWLGDSGGGIDESGVVESVSITTADHEVIVACASLASAMGLKLKQYETPDSEAVTLRFVHGPGHTGRNAFLDYVSKEQLAYAGKRIPDVYKYGSVETRLSVLAGLLDSDGHTHASDIELCLKSDTLLDDAAFVARSLGFQVVHTARKCNAQPHIADTYNGKKKGEPLGWCRRITITGNLTQLPMTIARKRAAVRKINKNLLCEGFKLQLVNETPNGTWAVLLDDVCAALDAASHGKKSKSWLNLTTLAESVDAALAEMVNQKMKATDATREQLRGDMQSTKAAIAELSGNTRAAERLQQQATLEHVVPASYADGSYYGFQVDGNGRFVVGERCFVTHNSTCVAMILGFYRPQQGRVTIDGHDLSTLLPSSVRRHIATVSQEPTLFATTIAENIAYGVDRDCTDEEIIAAAKVANAHQFITNFEQGYHTLVGERGIVLSGGQKQRVAIARAVLKNPAILLLDEATSALDSESEHLVKQALEHLMKGRSVIIVAHRLSTVKNADVVLVVEKGRVAEQGTHDELVKAGGIYHKLIQYQLTPD